MSDLGPAAPHRSKLHSARADLRRQPGHHFLQSDEFTSLLVSRRTLDRVHEPLARLYGLIDRATGDRYWIEAENLRVSYLIR